MRGEVKSSLIILVLSGLFSFSSVMAQRFPVGTVGSLKSTAFDHKSETLYTIFQDSIVTYSGIEFNQKKTYPLENPFPDFTDYYHPIIAGGILYFVEDNGGLVFEFAGDSLKRLDQSFSHRMQDAAAQFVRNDTIMRYGGYGFWSFRNFFTYYDPSNQGWEQVVPYGSSEFPHGGKFSQITQDSSNVYALWENYSMEQRPSTRIEGQDAWRFHMPSRTWHYLGDLMLKNPYEQVVISMGTKNLYLLRDKLAFTIDPVENEVIHYVINHEVNRGDVAFLKSKLCNHLQSYYHNGKFLLLKLDSKTEIPDPTSSVYYEVIPESELLQSPVAEEALYSSSSFPWWTTTGVFLLAGFGSWRFLYRKKGAKDKVQILDDALIFKGKRMVLDTRSMSLIKEFIKAKGELSSQKVTDILGNPDFSEGHNTKLKNQVIETLNLKLKTLLDSEKVVIQASRSKTDRRNKSYTLNISVFNAQT
jgi:hypothetical protein